MATRDNAAVAEGGEGTPVNPHDLWAHEALDFTPWLAANLGMLGDAVGLTLKPVTQEQAVGVFFLDILARTNDAAGLCVNVAIENQLTWTDHSHLGQLLTYVAGVDARVAIWVAPEFRHEHAAALHHLNERGGGAVRYYGVKVEVVRDGAGELQPRLLPVVTPEHWDEALTLPKQLPPNPAIEKHASFFAPLIAQVDKAQFPHVPVQLWGYLGRFFRSGFDPHVGYAVSFEYPGAWVYFHFRTPDNPSLKLPFFDALHEHREELESRIDPQGQWFWNRLPKQAWSSIGVRRDGSIDDPPERLAGIREWMLDLLPKFKDAFEELAASQLTKLRQAT